MNYIYIYLSSLPEVLIFFLESELWELGTCMKIIACTKEVLVGRGRVCESVILSSSMEFKKQFKATSLLFHDVLSQERRNKKKSQA